jgi:hypothetical protein
MEVYKLPLDWSAVNLRKELCRRKGRSAPQIESSRAGVSDVSYSVFLDRVVFFIT